MNEYPKANFEIPEINTNLCFDFDLCCINVLAKIKLHPPKAPTYLLCFS